MLISKNIHSIFDQGEYAAGVFGDLKRAFDSVNHTILLQKLEHHSIRGVTKKWFSSYLTKRRQFVAIDSFFSITKNISTGVPQGFGLGAFLFLIYIIDLHTCGRHSKTCHFANDTNILHSHKSLEVLVKNVKYDLRFLLAWLKANNF